MQLFGSIEQLKFLWSRNRCTLRTDHDAHEQYWVKDLKKIRRIGYALERVIVVDDTAKKHELNYGNLVRVRPAPTIVGRTIGIDTISHGVLTAVRLPDKKLFLSACY